MYCAKASLYENPSESSIAAKSLLILLSEVPFNFFDLGTDRKKKKKARTSGTKETRLALGRTKETEFTSEKEKRTFFLKFE